PEQEYFADGMVEEIITALSRIRWLFVIARNSSFTYKGRSVDVKQIGHELGVRYVLEGSVRKGGNRVREAAAKLLLAIQSHPGHSPSYRTLSVCYAHMGQLDEARAMIARLRTITPLVMPNELPYRKPKDRELFLSGLRLA